ncbi:Sec-independent protein translocase subunit TatA [Eionea flava]
MGFGGISIWQLLIILVIVVLLFGTKRLKGMGADIGGAVKGFKKALNNDDEQKANAENSEASEQNKESVAHDSEKK